MAFLWPFVRLSAFIMAAPLLGHTAVPRRVRIGLAMRIVFTAVQAAGDYIGLQMGLAFATFVTPDGANTAVLSRLLHMIGLLVFLAVDGHLIVINTLPIGYTGLDRGASIYWCATAAPSSPPACCWRCRWAALLIVNLPLGILNRSAPQLTVFLVGFPTH